jgi:hypothetical protein
MERGCGPLAHVCVLVRNDAEFGMFDCIHGRCAESPIVEVMAHPLAGANDDRGVEVEI